MESHEKTEQTTTPLTNLYGKLKENQEGLRIARIPKQAKEAFVKFAEEEFCGDYGMALKWLMDDLIKGDIKLVIAKINEIDARLTDVENTFIHASKGEKEVDKSVFKKMVDGTKIQVNK